MNPHSVTVNEANFRRITEAIGRLTRHQVQSGILYHPLAHGLDHPKFVGASDEQLALSDFYQVLFELEFSSIQRGIVPDLNRLRTAVRDAHRSGVVPVGIVCFEFQAVTIRAIKRFLVQMRDGGDLSLEDLVVPEVLENRQAKFARPLVDWAPDADSVTFSFDESWLVTNSNERPGHIDFDPGDGRGPRHVAIGSTLTVAYPSPGTKTIRIACHYASGTATSVSQIRLLAQGLPEPNETVQITAAREHKGVFAKGTMKIYYAPGHTNVVKPLFMWSGFNTGSTATALSVPTPFDVWDATAELMWAIDPGDLLEEARMKGFDIVMIEFADSRTYIQANAAMVETAILTINRRPSKINPGVLVTGSMGGIVARYALLVMEALGNPHEMAKVVFLDTPSLGAVMPMSVQYAMDFLSDKVEQVQKLRDQILDSFAARQMLVQKYRPNWAGQHDPQPDDLFVELQKSIIDIGGWPKKAELYAIANGNNSGIGQSTDKGETLQPAALLASFQRVDGHNTWKAGGEIYAMPNAPVAAEPGTKIIKISRVGKLNWEATVKKSLPWDTCPGGTSSFVNLFATNGWTTKNLVAGNTCFVPTLSALGFQIIDNLYATVPGPDKTPFTNFYAPTVNQPHAELNAANVAWLKSMLGIS